LGVVGRFVLDGRHAADCRAEPLVVVPVDVFRDGQLDLGQAAPGAAGFDQLGLVYSPMVFSIISLSRGFTSLAGSIRQP
jgi:hypothetical protein